MFPFWRPNTAFVATRVCSPGSAALATTSCVAISPAPSVRTDTLRLSRDLMLYSSGSSVKSIEQPCVPTRQAMDCDALGSAADVAQDADQVVFHGNDVAIKVGVIGLNADR